MEPSRLPSEPPLGEHERWMQLRREMAAYSFKSYKADLCTLNAYI